MKKRMAVWVVVLPLLVVFSTSLVGSALAANSTAEVKAGALIPAQPENGTLVLIENTGNDRNNGDRGDRDNGDHGDRDHFALFKEYFGLRSNARVCWVSGATLGALQARFDTSVSTIQVRHRGSFELVTVKGVSYQKYIWDVIGQSNCVMVKSHHTFFLPLDGHTS